MLMAYPGCSGQLRMTCFSCIAQLWCIARLLQPYACLRLLQVTMHSCALLLHAYTHTCMHAAGHRQHMCFIVVCVTSSCASAAGSSLKTQLLHLHLQYLHLQPAAALLIGVVSDALPAACPPLHRLPAVLFDGADLNADVRDTASGYRDPAIATPQDKVAGGWLLFVGALYAVLSLAPFPCASTMHLDCFPARLQPLCMHISWHAAPRCLSST